MSEPGKLDALAVSAGLTPGQADVVLMSFVFPDLHAAVRAQLSSGPARWAIEHSGEQAPATR